MEKIVENFIEPKKQCNLKSIFEKKSVKIIKKNRNKKY